MTCKGRLASLFQLSFVVLCLGGAPASHAATLTTPFGPSGSCASGSSAFSACGMQTYRVADGKVSASEIERRMREREAEYKAHPPTSEGIGIFPGSEEYNRNGSGVRIENMWHGIINGQDVYAFAGAPDPEDSDPTFIFDPQTAHGFVIVRKGRVNQKDAKYNQINTPTAVGTLHIVSSRGDVLTLESRQGYWFSLDVVNEQMVPIKLPRSSAAD